MKECACGTRMRWNALLGVGGEPLVVGQQHDLAAARRHFLHVGDGLFVELVARRDHDHRHVLVDERDRPVLQLARRIAFGMDIGNFLELEGAFQGDRIVDAAAEIEHVAGMGDLAGHRGDVLFVFQDLRHVARRLDQRADELLLLRLVDGAAQLAGQQWRGRQEPQAGR